MSSKQSNKASKCEGNVVEETVDTGYAEDKAWNNSVEIDNPFTSIANLGSKENGEKETEHEEELDFTLTHSRILKPTKAHIQIQ